MTAPFRRGLVYAAVIPPLEVEKYYLVVSNNSRNAALGTALVVRLTTSMKPALPSIVVLPGSEPFAGRALCDDVETMWPEDARRTLGTLSPPTMQLVGTALRAALSL